MEVLPAVRSPYLKNRPLKRQLNCKQDNEEYGTQAYWCAPGVWPVTCNSDLLSTLYREARYSGPSGAEPFDWFKTWSELRDHVEPLLSGREARILMLGASSWKSCHEYVAKHYQQGCGNSALSQDMYDDGCVHSCVTTLPSLISVSPRYHNICNIDFASSVIQSMREQHQDVRPQMECLYAQAESLGTSD